MDILFQWFPGTGKTIMWINGITSENASPKCNPCAFAFLFWNWSWSAENRRINEWITKSLSLLSCIKSRPTRFLKNSRVSNPFLWITSIADFLWKFRLNIKRQTKPFWSSSHTGWRTLMFPQTSLLTAVSTLNDHQNLEFVLLRYTRREQQNHTA